MPASDNIQFDNATLRERILTSGAGNARGSLTKVVSQYRDLIHQLVRNNNNNTSTDNTNTDDNHGDTTTSTKATIAKAATALQTELQLHDLEVRKSILTSQALSGNKSTYTDTLTQMQTSLTSIQQEIETLTTTLTQQRATHSRRKEYNALAKMANEKHPPIHTTQLELNRVNEQLQLVEREVQEQTEQLHIREKQLRVLMSSLGDLTASLKEEEIVTSMAEEEQEEGEEEEEGEMPPTKKRKR